MNEQELKNIFDDSYDGAKEESLGSFIKTFYSKKMRCIALLVWFWGLVFMAVVIVSGVQFFGSEDVKHQIAWATLFTCGYISIGLMKEMAWSMTNKHILSREIKRLELQIAELREMSADKQSDK